MNYKIYIFILSIFLVSCNQEEETSITEPAGTNYVESDRSVDEVYNSLRESVSGGEMSVMQEINFTENSLTGEQKMENQARLIFFGNPNIGTSILRENRLAALDLPQRMLVFEKEGKSYVMYNSPQYMKLRYNLQSVQGFDEMAQNLAELAQNAAGGTAQVAREQNIAAEGGIITVTSQENFDNTYRSLQESLNDNEIWRVVSQIDHAQNASGAGMQLPPTTLFLLTNPQMENAILGDNPTAGLDFPRKMLIWEDTDGTVKISWNDPEFLEQRHQLETDAALMVPGSDFRDIAEYAARDLEEYDIEGATEFDDEINQ